MNHTDTIAAIATPTGHGGIGIVRISGLKATTILQRLFLPTGRTDTGKSVLSTRFDSHRLYHGHIKDPRSGDCLDEVFAVLMAAPRSYTREDVVEIQCHGGPIILKTILALVTEQGARLANPGEFTQRAFLNGRIDLSQAEAVAEVISAQSRGALSMAARQLAGALKGRIGALISCLTDISAEVEAAIEFPEEVENGVDCEMLSEKLESDVLRPIEQLIASYQTGKLMRDGLKIVIAGRPNVGKSSLMNRLLEKERAIVTDTPGTTRDLVEDGFLLNGIPVILTDTAGLHESTDPVERAGIRKTHECLDGADLVLWVVASDGPLAVPDGFLIGKTQSKSMVLVVNKSDILGPDGNVQLPPTLKSIPTVFVSALTGEGIGELKSLIVSQGFETRGHDAQEGIVTSLRHKQCLDAALAAGQRALQGLTRGTPEDIVSLDLLEGVKSLKEITGEMVGDEVLNAIFNKFCIGK